MVLRKKWTEIFLLIATVLLLGACENKESTSEVTVQNSPNDVSRNGFLPLSEALEKHPVWFATTVTVQEELTKETSIKRVFVFYKGAVKYYDYMKKENCRSCIGGSSLVLNGKHLSVADVVDMTDKEIIKHAQQHAKEVNWGEYSLDIALDDTGNDTEFEYLITHNDEKNDEIPVFTKTIIPINFFNTDFLAIGTNRLVTEEFPAGGYLFTRVDTRTLFQLDGPDTKKKNVTIEGK